MHSDTKAFLDALFERCDQSGEGAFITLTAIHPGGGLPTPSHHLPLSRPDLIHAHLERLQQANAQGWGAYIGVATRRSGLGRWSRGGKADLLELPALFVDIDAPDPALWHLTFFAPPPSMLVSSGRGYHAYWLLDTPTTDFQQADLVLKGLAERLGGDSVLTVANSMRLPGTLNTKSDRENALCHLVDCDPERRYLLAEFASIIPPKSEISRAYSHKPWTNTVVAHTEGVEPVIDAVTDAVLHILDGHPRGNGFIAARCPLPHNRDKPGMHFSYHPTSGVGFCFGKHGKLSLQEMCHVLGICTLQIKSETGK